MEQNPYEAVSVNVLGTCNVVESSIKHHIEKFVLVSSDKAVNPASVMGASKRAAELFLSCMSQKRSSIQFIILRFGNVLGSNGSAIPLFIKQIESGGPLTITNMQMTRFFLTLDEVCNLIFHTSKFENDHNNLYVFQTGKPIKISTLASKLLSCYGSHVETKVIGLRPGEKIKEELIFESEVAVSTNHPNIKRVESKPLDKINVLDEIETLCNIKPERTPDEIISILEQVVADYKKA